MNINSDEEDDLDTLDFEEGEEEGGEDFSGESGE